MIFFMYRMEARRGKNMFENSVRVQYQLILMYYVL